jgi:polysaccharide export outer membrane protein
MRLGAGDLLEVSVYGVPELSTRTRVGPNGRVSLPLLNEVAVEGLTATEAEHKIEELLVKGDFLRSPHVTVSVTEFTSQGISVMGEVERPGIYPLLGKRRLFDVISQAGGMTTKAGKLVTLTHRASPDKGITVELSDDPARSIVSNIEVLPGDTVVVARAGIIYVVGEVQKPGGFMMENNGSLTVLQAIALAQGTTRLARLDRAKLIRKGPNGPEELSIDLKGILTAKKPDLQLMAEDIVFLPSSPAKNAGRRTLEAIVQSATGLAIYGPLR